MKREAAFCKSFSLPADSLACFSTLESGTKKTNEQSFTFTEEGEREMS
jgi:hypothetical protein